MKCIYNVPRSNNHYIKDLRKEMKQNKSLATNAVISMIIRQIPRTPMPAEDVLLSGADVFFRTVDDREVLLTVSVLLISLIF